MTKREILKRLFDIYNFAVSTSVDKSRQDAADFAFKIGVEIRWLLTDIAAPEEPRGNS